jgi:hypothetical protein
LNNANYKTKTVLLGASIIDQTTKQNLLGEYALNFAQVENFDANIDIFLKDNYTNTITDLRIKNSFMFNVDSNASSIADGRLEVLFINKNTSLEDALASRGVKVEVYPNPATDMINVELLQSNFKTSTLNIYNVRGEEVMSSVMTGNKKALDIQKLSNGVYLIKVSNSETGYSQTVKFVK